MNEKKLTDEELLRLLEIFAKDDEPNGVRLLAEGALDLIHRLQDEKQKVVQDYYCEAQHCDRQKDVIANQKAEIERLTEENEYLDMVAKQALTDYQNTQVQVDELKKERENVQKILYELGKCGNDKERYAVWVKLIKYCGVEVK